MNFTTKYYVQISELYILLDILPQQLHTNKFNYIVTDKRFMNMLRIMQRVIVSGSGIVSVSFHVLWSSCLRLKYTTDIRYIAEQKQNTCTYS